MTCKNCKWWGNVSFEFETEVYPDDYQGGPKIAAIHKPCGCPKIVYSGETSEGKIALLPPDTAHYYDMESYKARFCTGPDFGCVHYEFPA